MKLRDIVAVALLLTMLQVFGALPASAHGDKKHVVGIVEKISAEAVTVKTADGKSVEVKLVAATIYVDKAGKPAKFADVAVGQRVVIHATPKDTALIADELKFALAAPATKSSH